MRQVVDKRRTQSILAVVVFAAVLFLAAKPVAATPNTLTLDQIEVADPGYGIVVASLSGMLTGAIDENGTTITMDSGYFLAQFDTGIHSIYQHRVTNAVWDLDAEGNELVKIWQGLLTRADKQKLVTTDGKIRYYINVSGESDSAGVDKMCRNAETISLP